MIVVALVTMEQEKQRKKQFPPLPVSDDEEEPYVYDHRVETCSCGICWLARYQRDTWKKQNKK
jgi:hypothetical protein